MTEQGRSSADDVFINCPFDAGYKPIFDALVFTLLACEFRPRSALELDDGSQPRIEKLYAIIEACRYSIHDLSRTELDPVNRLPRFNMPFELGVFLGAKRFGDDGQRQKRCLILDVERYRYQKFLSDLAGMDISDHAGNVDRAIAGVRDWLANVSRRALPSAAKAQSAYKAFLAQKTDIADVLGFEVDAIPYVDYEKLVMGWLLEAGRPRGGPRSKKSKR